MISLTWLTVITAGLRGLGCVLTYNDSEKVSVKQFSCDVLAWLCRFITSHLLTAGDGAFVALL